jgi:hypothetical protein
MLELVLSALVHDEIELLLAGLPIFINVRAARLLPALLIDHRRDKRPTFLRALLLAIDVVAYVLGPPDVGKVGCCMWGGKERKK